MVNPLVWLIPKKFFLGIEGEIFFLKLTFGYLSLAILMLQGSFKPFQKSHVSIP